MRHTDTFDCLSVSPGEASQKHLNLKCIRDKRYEYTMILINHEFKNDLNYISILINCQLMYLNKIK